MLFGNGLSALLTLFGISAALVAAVHRRAAADRRRSARARAGRAWLAYFGALGAGFMLLEVALLQRFVLLLGHPVYSLTVTLFSLLLGTGLGSLISRRIDAAARPAVSPCRALDRRSSLTVAGGRLAPALAHRHRRSRGRSPLRIAVAVALLVPSASCSGCRCRAACGCWRTTAPTSLPWGWGINGAFSVVGATLAVFIAMNWGFSVTLLPARSCTASRR